MDKDEKFKLEQQTKRENLMLRFRNGCKSILHNRKSRIIFAGYLLLITIVWLLREKIFHINGNNFFTTINLLIFQIAYPFWVVIGFVFVVSSIGTPRGWKAVQDNLNRIGFFNQAGETPLLISQSEDKKNHKVTIIEFITKGISYSEWENKKEKLEAALNMNIVRIEEGKNKRYMVLYAVSAAYDLPECVYWKKHYLNDKNFVLVLGEGLVDRVEIDLSQIPHILLGGATGSGKSVLLKNLLMQCIQKYAVVCIADFKGGVDFSSVWHKRCMLIITEQALLNHLESLVCELERRKKLLNENDVANIDEYNNQCSTKLSRHIFACDEIAEILDKTGLSKEQKEFVTKIESKLSIIARQGRAFGIHLILATQRPDATILQGQIRNNMNCRICGRADNVLSQIILDNGDANDKIPKHAQGRFLMYDGTVFQGYLFNEYNEL